MNKIKRFIRMFLYSFISKKTLISIILVLLILLFSKTSSNAVELGGVEYPEFPTEVADYEYYIISVHPVNSKIKLFISEKELFIKPNYDNLANSRLSTIDDSYYIYIYVLENNSWVPEFPYQTSGGSGGDKNYANYIYSSFDIYFWETNTIAYPKTPLPFAFPYIADTDETLNALNTDYLLIMPRKLRKLLFNYISYCR